jgi:hypothetical protein
MACCAGLQESSFSVVWDLLQIVFLLYGPPHRGALRPASAANRVPATALRARGAR